ncbi:protein RETICULATA-RELATED 1, chloroplastic-like [Tasmannia lanceolata]|uniref:protein RETICULATA-RELATED 1, chloroplastic-like n=1 Tax=Tasmannia lanceolata TaxID=3420 RepID=UPI0040644FEC
MAFCYSSSGLQNSAYLSRECSVGIDFARHWSESAIVEVRRFGGSRSTGIKCWVFVLTGVLSTSSRVKSSGFGRGRNKKSMLQPRGVKVESVGPTFVFPTGVDPSSSPDLDDGGSGGNSIGGNGSNGKFPSGGGGGDSDHGKDDKEEEELGPILKFEEVMRETEARGATLPSDMLEAAKTIGIPKLVLLRYLDLQESVWPLGVAMRSCSLLRNRMLADPAFLFKVGIEIVIDSCCATFAEVQKRGKDFWAEFELYVADLLVGGVVNIALVGMLAPYARIGQPSISKGFFGSMQRTCGALPSSVFEAERPRCKFSIDQRIGTYFYKGVLYASVGFACGLIGQGIANSIMTAKRSIKKSEGDIPVPPLVKSAVLWGVFLGVSSNTRYQIINGLERVVETSPMAKRVPPVAMAFTVGVRFANNIYGGMQFVDWARWSGVQ